MKANGQNWALRVFLTTLVVVGMSVPASTAWAVARTDMHDTGRSFHAASDIIDDVRVLPVVGEEALLALDEPDPILDDTSQDSQDSTDETRIPSQWVESALFWTGFSGTAGPLLEHLAKEGLATQVICCVWRC